MSTIKNYLSLIKFSHTIFAMPFALIGFFLASRESTAQWFAQYFRDYQPSPWLMAPPAGKPIWALFLLMLLCMVFARSAAMAFNRYLDRHWDALNPRTAIREIPKGIISPSRALTFTIANALLFMATTYMINWICFCLSPVALAIVLGYSYTKRFTPLCHLVLGLGLSLAPIGAYLAVTGSFALVPVLFSAAVLCWVSGFDIIYALQDEEFDRQQGLHSIPSRLGKQRALWVSTLLHILSGMAVTAAGYLGGFHWLYVVGVLVFIGCLIYQHSIVSPYDLRRVNLAFMTTNGVASVIFAVFVIADLFIFK